jgi:glucosamine-6-phosphate deaminase
MRVIVRDDYEGVSREAARLVARQVLLKPDTILGLPTGETPVGMYAELVQMSKRGLIDFSRTATFNLDEFYGLSADHPQSYHRYMHERFFAHVDVAPSNVFIFDGTAQDVATEWLRYEDAVMQHGSIDLQVLGIGPNGHIGFNEPGANWEMMVGLVELSEVTRRREAARFGGFEHVPECALTMGIKAIMQARAILLIATGDEKAEILRRALTGPILPDIPASVLQLHPNVTVILDHTASSAAT